MYPMESLRLAIGDFLAENLPLNQPTDALLIRLVAADFTPSEGLVPGDLTFASFDGSTAKSPTVATDWQVGTDPATNEQLITAPEPAGGWRWEVTGVTNLPQSIYGFALLTAASAELLAVEKLAAPVTLIAVTNEINLGKAQFRVGIAPLT
jgi:hypothetical protein